MQSVNAKPNKVSDKEKYRIFGILNDSQRSVAYVIIERARRGLWTRYDDCDGSISPEKRVGEIIGLGINIRFRRIAGDREHKVEFCL